MTQSRLTTRSLEILHASAFVTMHHRTHVAPVGALCAFEVCDDTGARRGVATLGRPVARGFGRHVVEVTRVATDGCPNACSALYGACRREAMRRGYSLLVTYTLPHEPGVSLMAAGFRVAGVTRGGDWRNRSGRASSHSGVRKFRWAMALPAKAVKS